MKESEKQIWIKSEAKSKYEAKKLKAKKNKVRGTNGPLAPYKVAKLMQNSFGFAQLCFEAKQI